MIRPFDTHQTKQISYVNYVLISMLLTASIVSHLIAARFVDIGGYPVIPATFTYMLVFSLSDMLAGINGRKFVILVLLGETIVNLAMVATTTAVNATPEPAFFHYGQAYHEVFGGVPQLYIANLGGGLIIGVLDILLFSHWYRVKRMSFFSASFLSTILSLSIYTYFTDYFAFRDNYPEQVHLLAQVNIVTNFACVFCYSVISAWVMTKIARYIK